MRFCRLRIISKNTCDCKSIQNWANNANKTVAPHTYSQHCRVDDGKESGEIMP